jgi:hypothetical protein
MMLILSRCSTYLVLSYLIRVLFSPKVKCSQMSLLFRLGKDSWLAPFLLLLVLIFVPTP